MWQRRPASEVLSNLPDSKKIECVQFEPEWCNLAVVLIERQPLELNTVGHRPLDLLDGNRPFRSVHQIIGNAGFLAAITILAPILWQEEIAGHRASEWIRLAAADVYQMLPDDTVLDLPGLTAPLTLHTWRLIT